MLWLAAKSKSVTWQHDVSAHSKNINGRIRLRKGIRGLEHQLRIELKVAARPRAASLYVKRSCQVHCNLGGKL